MGDILCPDGTSEFGIFHVETYSIRQIQEEKMGYLLLVRERTEKHKNSLKKEYSYNCSQCITYRVSHLRTSCNKVNLKEFDDEAHSSTKKDGN